MTSLRTTKFDQKLRQQSIKVTQILNVAEAEVETKVQPDGVSDDLGPEAVASIGQVVRTDRHASSTSTR
jgi:hypothetical protein